jgi:CheY-like chemotaxis protein
VFRVRPPEDEAAAAAPAPPAAVRPTEASPRPAPAARERAASPAPAAAAADPARTVLVAIPSEDLAKQTAEALRARGLGAPIVHDGVEAMLEVQRRMPRAVVLSATLPKMYGFQVCEVMKRNDSLRGILVVLAGAIHHPERYRRPPGDLYGADAYLEEPDLPDGLWPILERHGVPLSPPAAGPALRPRSAAPAAAPAPPAVPRPAPPRAAAPRPAPPRPAAPRSAPPSAAAADGLAEERARADRLARIIVSDIVLYNEEKFAAAVRRGDVATALAGELAEGRGLFAERVDPRVRAEGDRLLEELLRVARARGMA